MGLTWSKGWGKAGCMVVRVDDNDGVHIWYAGGSSEIT